MAFVANHIIRNRFLGFIIMLIVFGSINLDVTYHVKKLPKAGQTVISDHFLIGPGGKGANQALASARMGTKTALVGKVGDDASGMRVLNNLKKNEVMTSGVAKADDNTTGTSTIIVDKNGENQIIYSPGANAEVTADQLPGDILHKKNMLLVQMELPLEQTMIGIKNARDNGAKVICNMAPAQKLPAVVLKIIDYLIINEHEAIDCLKSMKLEVDSDPTKQALTLAREGNLTCVITLASKGCVAVTADEKIFVIQPPPIEKPIDTTGAGDCFCGTFAACLHEGFEMKKALQYAVTAATLSCLRPGAQSSYPYMDDIQKIVEKK